MNIQSTLPRTAAVRAQHQGPPSQPPAQQQAQPPKDSFEVNFSKALEVTVPLYTSITGAVLIATPAAVGGGILGGIVGGFGGALLGGVIGSVGGVATGMMAGDKFGTWAMKESGRIGEAHDPENPARGKAAGQAVAGGAITFLTGTPAMTALVIGGSAAYAAHKTAAG